MEHSLWDFGNQGTLISRKCYTACSFSHLSLLLQYNITTLGQYCCMGWNSIPLPTAIICNVPVKSTRATWASNLGLKVGLHGSLSCFWPALTWLAIGFPIGLLLVAVTCHWLFEPFSCTVGLLLLLLACYLHRNHTWSLVVGKLSSYYVRSMIP